MSYSSDFVTATVFKASQDVPLGMSLSGSAPSITIAKISPTSLCGQTELEAGMILHTINNRSFQSNEDAVKCVKESIGQVVIVAKRKGSENGNNHNNSHNNHNSFQNSAESDLPTVLMPEYDTPSIIQADLDHLNQNHTKRAEEQLQAANAHWEAQKAAQKKAQGAPKPPPQAPQAPQPRDLLPGYQAPASPSKQHHQQQQQKPSSAPAAAKAPVKPKSPPASPRHNEVDVDDYIQSQNTQRNNDNSNAAAPATSAAMAKKHSHGGDYSERPQPSSPRFRPSLAKKANPMAPDPQVSLVKVTEPSGLMGRHVHSNSYEQSAPPPVAKKPPSPPLQEQQQRETTPPPPADPKPAPTPPKRNKDDPVFVTIEKPAKNSKVGLILKGNHPRITITSIRDNTLATNTELEIGMTILTINDIVFHTSVEAIEYLRNNQGEIEIEAQHHKDEDQPSLLPQQPQQQDEINLASASQPEDQSIAVPPEHNNGNDDDDENEDEDDVVHAVIRKPTIDTPVGLSLKGAYPNLEISKLRPGTLAAKTHLQEGWIVNSINGKTFPNGVEAIDYIKHNVGEFHIVAKSNVLKVSIHKATADAKLGVAMAGVHPNIRLTKVTPGGLCGATSLTEGMELVDINGNRFPNGVAACSYMKQLTGVIHITVRRKPAEASSGDANKILKVNIHKSTADAKVGIAMAGHAPNIKITKISPGGLGSTTSLREGMELIDINGNTFPNSVAACTYMKHLAGNVTISVRPNSSQPLSATNVMPAVAGSAPAVTRPNDNNAPVAAVRAQPAQSSITNGAVVARAQPAQATTGNASKPPLPQVPKGTNIAGRPPPPGQPGGGVWELRKYHGPTTTATMVVVCLLAGLCFLWGLCFPCDERWVYIINGKSYDEMGQYIGPDQPKTRR